MYSKMLPFLKFTNFYFMWFLCFANSTDISAISDKLKHRFFAVNPQPVTFRNTMWGSTQTVLGTRYKLAPRSHWMAVMSSVLTTQTAGGLCTTAGTAGVCWRGLVPTSSAQKAGTITPLSVSILLCLVYKQQWDHLRVKISQVKCKKITLLQHNFSFFFSYVLHTGKHLILCTVYKQLYVCANLQLPQF